MKHIRPRRPPDEARSSVGINCATQEGVSADMRIANRAIHR